MYTHIWRRQRNRALGGGGKTNSMPARIRWLVFGDASPWVTRNTCTVPSGSAYIEKPFHEGESEDCFRFARSVVERSGTLVPPSPPPTIQRKRHRTGAPSGHILSILLALGGGGGGEGGYGGCIFLLAWFPIADGNWRLYRIICSA